MQLSWSDPTSLAAALLKAHPEADRLSLGRDRLRDMIVVLPGFKDAPSPPQPACLDHILWTWMRMADGGFAVKG